MGPDEWAVFTCSVDHAQSGVTVIVEGEELTLHPTNAQLTLTLESLLTLQTPTIDLL